MSDDKNSLSPSQFTFAVACFIQSASLLSSLATGLLHQDTWLVAIFASVCYIPVLAIISALIKRFPDKDLYDINEAVFGKFGGKIVSILYLFFFFQLATLNIRDGGNFIQQTIMNKTPVVLLSLSLVALASYALLKGLQTVGKYSTAFTCINIVIIVFSFLTTVKVFDFGNLLPVMVDPPQKYLHGTNVIMSIPLGEIVCFMTIAPQVMRQKKGLGKELFIGYAIGVLVFIAVIIRDIGVLGNTLGFYALPSFEALKMAELSTTIGNLEILFAVILVILIFFRTAILSYAFLLMLGKILNLKTFRPLIISTMSIALVYSFFIFKDRLTHANYGSRVVPILWFFFESMLPIATIIIAMIRKKKSA